MSASDDDIYTNNTILPEDSQENIRYQSLVKENETLKAQFEQALLITNEYHELRKTGDEMVAKLRSLEGENNDLKKRLEYAEKAYEEAENRASEEKTLNQRIRSCDKEATNYQLEQIKACHARTVQKLENELQMVQKSYEENLLIIKTNANIQDTLLQNAEFFFERTFDKFSDFFDFLDSQVQASKTYRDLLSLHSSSSKNEQDDPQRRIRELQDAVSKARIKLSDANMQNEGLNSTIADLKRELIQKDDEISSLRRQKDDVIACLRDEHRSSTENKDSEIRTLRKKIDQLTSELERIRGNRDYQYPASGSLATGRAASPQQRGPSPQNRIHSPSKQEGFRSIQTSSPARCYCNDQRYGCYHQGFHPGCNSHQHQQIYSHFDQRQSPEKITKPILRSSPKSGLSDQCCVSSQQFNSSGYYDSSSKEFIEQIRALNDQKDDLTIKVRQLEHEKDRLTKENVSLSQELNSLKTVYNESKAHCDTLRVAIDQLNGDRKPTLEEEKVRKKFASLKRKILDLEKVNEAQKQIVFDQQFENEKIKNDLHEASQRKNYLEREVDALNKQIRDLNDTISDMDHKLKKPQVTEADFCPATTWNYSAFEPELINEIEKIGNNSSLQIPSKIHQCFRVIQSYYEDRAEGHLTLAQEAIDNSKLVRQTVEKFVVDLSLLLIGQPVNFDQFIEENEFLLQAVEKIRKERDDYRRNAESASHQLNHIIKAFDIKGGNDLIDMVNDFKTKISQMNNENEKLAKRLKQTRHQLSSREKELASISDSTYGEIAKLKVENSELREKLSKSTQEVSKTKSEIHKLQSQLREEQHERQQNECAIRGEQDDAITKLQHDMYDLETQLRAELAENEQKLAEAEEQLHYVNQENDKLRELVNSQKRSVTEHDRLIQQAKDELNEKNNKLVKSFKEERENLVHNYENTIQELQKQCEVYRVDAEKLYTKIATLEKKEKENRKNYAKTKREKNQLEEDIRLKREEFLREKKLLEATYHTEIIKAESELSQQVNMISSKCEEQKMELIRVAMNEFREFCSPEDGINERSYRNCIQAAKEALKKMTKSDENIRRITKAVDRQTTEDAVARLLL